jgi:tRNA pseudouridine55 synthase
MTTTHMIPSSPDSSPRRGPWSERAIERPFPGGILVIDKPEGLTSFRVVDRVKKKLHLEKAGHCGTLDPFATGVLVICLNQATHVADLFSCQEKVYQAVFRLGTETDTLDRTGQVTHNWDGPPVSRDEVRSALEQFVGPCVQEVPCHAAVKVQGRRLYQWTREGVGVDRPSREIHIQSISMPAYHWPEVTVEVKCSKGTYIRQLAADLGRLLGCGAHVSELRRIESGQFRMDQALSLGEILEPVNDNEPTAWREKLISINEALAHLPAVVVEDETVLRRLSDGHLDPGWESENRERFEQQRDPVRIVSGANQLLALWWPQPEAGRRRRLRLFDRDSSFNSQTSIPCETKED